MEVLSDTTTTILSKEELVVEHETTSGSEEEEDQSGASSVDDEESEAKSVPSSEDRPADDTAGSIPENENANESWNATSSPMKNSPSIGKSDSKDENDPSDVNNDATNGNARVQTIVFPSSWSESLKSPTDLLGFSPSELESCHGLGKEDYGSQKNHSYDIPPGLWW
jgi:hypothetical protein